MKKNKLYLSRLPSKCRTAEKPFIITVLGSGVQIINITMVANCGPRVSLPLPRTSHRQCFGVGIVKLYGWTNGWSRECQTFLKLRSELIENFTLSATAHSVLSLSLSLFLSFYNPSCFLLFQIVNGLSKRYRQQCQWRLQQQRPYKRNQLTQIYCPKA